MVEDLACVVDAARTRAFVGRSAELEPVDGWVRDQLVASLPADVLVVIAGRNTPDTPWRADRGWREVVECLPVAELTPGESELLLATRASATIDARGSPTSAAATR